MTLSAKQAAQLLGVAPRTISDVQQADILATLRAAHPEIETAEWRKRTLAELADRAALEGLRGDFTSLVMDLRYVPDGFMLDKHLGELLFFEIEVFSPMTGAKLRAYGKFAIDMAAYGLAFAVLVINKYGHIHELDLMPYYADWLVQQGAAA